MAAKRRRFQISAGAAPSPNQPQKIRGQGALKTQKIPRAGDVKEAKPSLVALDKAVLNKLEEPTAVLGFDIAANTWRDIRCGPDLLGNLVGTLWVTNSIQDWRALCNWDGKVD